jgi:hypothetical protein
VYCKVLSGRRTLMGAGIGDRVAACSGGGAVGEFRGDAFRQVV